MQSKTEVDGLKDLNMTQIKEEFHQDNNYKRLIEAFKIGDNLNMLHDHHPAKKWASSWDTISQVGNEGLLLVDRSKVIIPEGMQRSIIEDLHKNTHGSFQRIKDTVQESMVWLRWKETI